MNQDMVVQLVRYVLLAVGPWIASHGWMTDDNWGLIAGALITIGTAIWGVYVKWNTTSVPAHVAAEVPTVSPVTGKTIK